MLKDDNRNLKEANQELLKELNDNFKMYAFQFQKLGTVLNQINKNFYHI